MADVFDVAQSILSRQGEMTAMKLQKLAYYSQAWHIVWTDNTLFENRIEAWRDGPVCPDLWKEHANTFRISQLSRGVADALTRRERMTLKKVLKFYGRRSAQWLSDLTHMEDPWLDARRGAGPSEPGNNAITPHAMSRYYSAL